MAQKKDEGLNGNEKIEQAVYQLQQEPTQEQLAHTLTVIRRRMRENGQVFRDGIYRRHEPEGIRCIPGREDSL